MSLTRNVHEKLIADGKMPRDEGPPRQRNTPQPLDEPDGQELIVEADKGYAYQRDRTRSVPYGVVYYREYVKRSGTPIADKLNTARVAITEKYCTSRLFDVGIGSGEFIESCHLPAIGFDVNHVAVAWLNERGAYHDPYTVDGIPPDVDGVTLWDVLEHLPTPPDLLSLVRPGCYLFVSIPIFADLKDVRRSKHFKPDEHYWYFTEAGLIGYLDEQGFSHVETTDAETKAGREGIKTFVFRRRAAASPRRIATGNHTDIDPGDGECVSVEDFGGWDKAIHFCVPAGIGDISWVYSKICHLRAMSNREVILSCPGDDHPRRGEDFIRLLPEVHWGGYVNGLDSWRVLSHSLPADWPAKMGDWTFFCRSFIQNLAANIHLESGRPLSSWLPCLPTNYHYGLNIAPAEQERAAVLVGNPPKSLTFAVYVSNRDKDSIRAGGWSLWSEQQWAEFLFDVADIPECKGVRFVFLGADYDRDKTEAVAKLVEKHGLPVTRVIGEPLGVALGCLMRCHYCFSYPSGIGIMANVFSVPGMMLLPWLLSELKHTYADPSQVGNRFYWNHVNPRPEDALGWFSEVSLPMCSWTWPKREPAHA